MNSADPNQLNRFSHALNTLRTSMRDLNGEPQFRHLAAPPGKALFQAFRENLAPSERRAVFYVEVPATEQRPRGETWLLKVLLQAWGDPDWNKREAAYTKELRLKEQLKRATELVVVADIHRLADSPQQFELLLSLFQTDEMMPLLVIGEPSQMHQLLASNQRFLWRFVALNWE